MFVNVSSFLIIRLLTLIHVFFNLFSITDVRGSLLFRDNYKFVHNIACKNFKKENIQKK